VGEKGELRIAMVTRRKNRKENRLFRHRTNEEQPGHDTMHRTGGNSTDEGDRNRREGGAKNYKLATIRKPTIKRSTKLGSEELKGSPLLR